LRHDDAFGAQRYSIVAVSYVGANITSLGVTSMGVEILAACAGFFVGLGVRLSARTGSKSSPQKEESPFCKACDNSGYADYAAVPCEACGGEALLRRGRR
jgi:hypothetical protein